MACIVVYVNVTRTNSGAHFNVIGKCIALCSHVSLTLCTEGLLGDHFRNSQMHSCTNDTLPEEARKT